MAKFYVSSDELHDEFHKPWKYSEDNLWFNVLSAYDQAGKEVLRPEEHKTMMKHLVQEFSTFSEKTEEGLPLNANRVHYRLPQKVRLSLNKIHCAAFTVDAATDSKKDIALKGVLKTGVVVGYAGMAFCALAGFACLAATGLSLARSGGAFSWSNATDLLNAAKYSFCIGTAYLVRTFGKETLDTMTTNKAMALYEDSKLFVAVMGNDKAKEQMLQNIRTKKRTAPPPMPAI